MSSVPEKRRKLVVHDQGQEGIDASAPYAPHHILTTNGKDPVIGAANDVSTTNGQDPVLDAANGVSTTNGKDTAPGAASDGSTTNGQDPALEPANDGSTTNGKDPALDAANDGSTRNGKDPALEAANDGSTTNGQDPAPGAANDGSTVNGEDAAFETASSRTNGIEDVKPLVISPLLIDVKLQKEVEEHWTAGKRFSDGDFKFERYPFRHVEIRNFISLEDDFLGELVDKVVDKFPFEDKATDLFQFRQSEDLKSFDDPHISQLIDFLSGPVLEFLRKSTGLPLNNDLDLFLSQYGQTDFLLCHDDELESRRIAFILYLNKDWKAEFGGNLDLYSSNEEGHPEGVVSSLTPEFNKFVFFEVGATSFHQVSEVRILNKSRLALSGWFYGESVARPKVQFPTDQGYSLNQTKIDEKGIMKRDCAESYVTPETQSDINEQLAEESQVLIPGFLKDTVYSSICSDIVEEDVRDGGNVFSPAGPPNVRSFQQAFNGPPSSSSSDSNTFQNFRRLFHSEEVLQFLENITEFPFTSCPLAKVRSSLRKYSAGSYCLLRSGGAKQTGEPLLPSTDEEEEGEEEEEEPHLVDITFYFGSKWSEKWGGLSIYSTADGEQLITIPPEGNCLTVVVRSSSVHSYVNYVNCLAKDEVYFAYTMEFAFDGHFSY